MSKADLHIHTSVSDCSQHAEEVLQLAQKEGVTHLAFTDHDTTQKAGEHVALAKTYGIRAVPAVELSAFYKKSGKKVHILGYGYTDVSPIEKLGQKTLQKRNENCRKQIEILQKLGYRMDLDAIQRLANGCIYKQHILDYLVKTGQSEAVFGKVYWDIFKNGGPCDFDIAYPEAVDAVQAIVEAKGVAVLAHPGQQDNFEVLPELVEAGLKGIERNHPANSIQVREKIDMLCQKYALFYTGGSDYHGRYEKEKNFPGKEYITDIGQLGIFF